MQHERVRVGPKLGDDERHLVRHQPRNERHVALQAIELRHQHGGRALRAGANASRSYGRRSSESAPLPVSISVQLADQFETFGRHESVRGLALRLKAEPRPAPPVLARGNYAGSGWRGPDRAIVAAQMMSR